MKPPKIMGRNSSKKPHHSGFLPNPPTSKKEKSLHSKRCLYRCHDCILGWRGCELPPPFRVQVDIVYSAEQVSKALQAILRHRIEAKLDHPSGTPRKERCGQRRGDANE